MAICLSLVALIFIVSINIVDVVGIVFGVFLIAIFVLSFGIFLQRGNVYKILNWNVQRPQQRQQRCCNDLQPLEMREVVHTQPETPHPYRALEQLSTGSKGASSYNQYEEIPPQPCRVTKKAAEGICDPHSFADLPLPPPPPVNNLPDDYLQLI